jgi:hypothetical protein
MFSFWKCVIYFRIPFLWIIKLFLIQNIILVFWLKFIIGLFNWHQSFFDILKCLLEYKDSHFVFWFRLYNSLKGLDNLQNEFIFIIFWHNKSKCLSALRILIRVFGVNLSNHLHNCEKFLAVNIKIVSLLIIFSC